MDPAERLAVGGRTKILAPAYNQAMAALYRADDRDLLTNVLSAAGIHLGIADVLDGLTTHQAHAKPHGLPHSIAEIVAHMCFWQEWFNGCAVTGFTGIPEHAADGWPAVADDGWDAIRTRYLQSLEEAKRIATESASLRDAVLPPGVDVPVLARESRGSGILHAALHNSHHLGQIITMRQLLGLWPPPAGTITW